ncbi:MAG: hypothetical protein AAF747_06875 [Planctomycetota bacterium]
MQSKIRRQGRASVLLVSVGLAAASASGQMSNWQNPFDGSWGNAANWSNGVPNGNLQQAVIDASGFDYVVELDISRSVDSLLIDSDNATLQITSRSLSTNSINVQRGRISLNSGSLSGSTIANSGTITAVGGSTISSTIFAQQGTLDITTVAGVTTSLTRSGDMTNSGTMNLTSTTNNISQIFASSTITNSGTFNVLPGNGGSRLLSIANLVNTSTGSINIETNTPFNRTSSTLSNSGTLSTAPGATLTFGGSGLLNFNQNAGTIDNQGGLAVTSDAFNFAGGTITGNDVVISGGFINITGSGAGGFDVTGASQFSGTIAAGQNVDVLGVPGVTGTLTAATGAVNNGTFTMSSTSNNISQLSSAGVFTNSGQFNVLPGNGGARNISVDEFVNSGVLDIDESVAFNRTSAAFTNTGAIETAAGTNFNFLGTGVQTFNQNGGNINNLGSLTINGETFNFSGGTITGNDIRINGGVLNISGTGAGGLEMTNFVAFTGEVAADQTLDIIGVPGITSTLSAATGSSNDGDLTLTSTSNNIAQIDSSGTFTNTGSITVQPGNGGGREFGIFNFVTTGDLQLNTDTAFNSTNGTLTNAGTIGTAPGATFSVVGSGTQTFNHNSGTIDNQGAISLIGEIFNFNGGDITGNDISVSGGQLNLASPGTGGFDLFNFVTTSGLLGSQQSIDIIGTPGVTSTLAAVTGTTSNGTITLTSTSNNIAQIDSAGNFINNGSIIVEAGGGGGREFGIFDFDNTGNITINADTTFNATNGTWDNSGDITTAPGATLTIFGSGTQNFNHNAGTLDNQGGIATAGEIFNFNGGDIIGNDVRISGGQLNITSSGTGGFDFSNSVAFSGTLGSQQSVDVIGSPGITSTFAAADGSINNGIITLTSTSNNIAQIDSVGTVTNNGSILVEPGPGGGREIGVFDFVNNGSVVANANLAYNATNGTFTNAGVLLIADATTTTITGAGTVTFDNAGGRVQGLGTLNLVSADVFNNDGIFAPGRNIDNGTLTVIGNWEQSSAGELRIGISAAEDSDQLLITGNAQLDGELAVQLRGPRPSATDEFVILNAATLTGTLNGGASVVTIANRRNFTFDVVYDESAGTVTLTNFAIPAPGAATALAIMGLAAARRRR